MNKTLIERIYRNFYSLWFLWGLCFAINILTLLLVAYKINPGNRTLALHYNVLVGVEWYGKGRNLFFIPAIGFMLTVINAILYRALKKTNFFLPGLTLFVSLCLQISLMASVLFLVKVN